MGKNKHRAFVSISLLICLIIVLITAITIEVVEGMVPSEIWADWLLNPENQDASVLGKISHFGIAIHVVVGYLMVILSIFHIKKNWVAFKSYFISKRAMKKDKQRVFASITLFVCIIIILITAVALHILEFFIVPDEMWADWELNPDNQDLYFAGRIKPFITGAHVISGYLFVIFSGIHIVKNKNVLKSYFRSKKTED